MGKFNIWRAFSHSQSTILIWINLSHEFIPFKFNLETILVTLVLEQPISLHIGKFLGSDNSSNCLIVQFLPGPTAAQLSGPDCKSIIPTVFDEVYLQFFCFVYSKLFLSAVKPRRSMDDLLLLVGFSSWKHLEARKVW